jgi:hypothetical protein
MALSRMGSHTFEGYTKSLDDNVFCVALEGEATT